MKQIAGIWLPDAEEHLGPMLRGSPRVDDKGTYQYGKLSFAIQFDKRMRLAVDVGAHVGLWSRVLAKRYQHVEAFEPSAECAELFALNAPTARLHGVALGDQPGSGRLGSPVDPGNTCTRAIGAPDGEPVEIQTLDSFGLDPTFLKIDTEGTELLVIRGAAETIRRARPVIIVEQKPGHPTRHGLPEHGARDFLIAEFDYREVREITGDHILVPR